MLHQPHFLCTSHLDFIIGRANMCTTVPVSRRSFRRRRQGFPLFLLLLIRLAKCFFPWLSSCSCRPWNQALGSTNLRRVHRSVTLFQHHTSLTEVMIATVTQSQSVQWLRHTCLPDLGQALGTPYCNSHRYQAVIADTPTMADEAPSAVLAE